MADDKKKTPTIRARAFGRSSLRKQEEFDLNAVRSTALQADDEFSHIFKDRALSQKVDLIQPPYSQSSLSSLIQLNNALGPCVEAMVNNIDGTGHAIRLTDMRDADDDDADEDAEGNTEIEDKQSRIENFFDEVFPGESMITLRKKVRRDLEETGNGYIEVMRNLEGDIVFLRHVRAKDIRLVKLDAAISKPVTLFRNGEQVEVQMMASERRYAQVVGNNLVFFREMHASRDLHKGEGLWEGTEGMPEVEPKDRANELIHLTTIPDSRSPYGLPRWVNQLPSVLGSRRAEESNLEYFDSGGVPPVLLTVSGGTAAEEAVKALEMFFSGEAKNKRRGMILEIENVSGSIDEKGASAKVDVHKFGAEQVSDSMFENYDSKCEKRIRRSFRLPPLFVGMAEDFSFATAFASYTVAEAQVFQPERNEFDEMINNLIMPELDPDGLFEFVSLPISVNDVEQRLEAIKIALEAGGIDAEGVIEAINTLVNLDLKYDPEASKRDISGLALNTPEEQSATQTGEATAGGEVVPFQRAVKKSSAADIVQLATEANDLMNAAQRDPQTMIKVSQEIAGLSAEDAAVFRSVLSVMQFESVDNDPTGLARLAGCSWAVLAGQTQT